MTRVVYDDMPHYQQMRLDGHAGDPVVCAGISALSQTLIANLLQEEKRGHVTLNWAMETPGEMWIQAWPSDGAQGRIREMFGFTMEGLRNIMEQYGKNIEIEEGKRHGGI